MRTYKIYLIRHGLTDANKEGRFAGSTDVHLSEEGVAGLLELTERYEYPGVGLVYSSPLKRAVETARLIYPAITPITVADLSEYSFGEFENKSLEELKLLPKFKEWIKDSQNTVPEGGEPQEAFRKRIVEGIHSVILDMMKKKVSEAAVIAHGGVIMSLLSICGLPKRSASEWTVDNGTGYTLMINASLWDNAKAFEVFTPVPFGIKADEVMSDYQRLYSPSETADAEPEDMGEDIDTQTI